MKRAGNFFELQFKNTWSEASRKNFQITIEKYHKAKRSKFFFKLQLKKACERREPKQISNYNIKIPEQDRKNFQITIEKY